MLEPSERYLCFQQDNATAHTLQATVNLLREFFDELLISRGLWPPRSHGYIPAGLFLGWIYQGQGFHEETEHHR